MAVSQNKLQSVWCCFVYTWSLLSLLQASYTKVVFYFFFDTNLCMGRRDHMVVGFTTTCAINAYHH